MKFVIALGFVLLVALTNALPMDDLPELQPGEVCTPGNSFRIGCNRCFCGGNGINSCTKMLCNAKWHAEVPEMDCVLGTTFQMDCNTCICALIKDKPAAACTMMKCH